MHFHWSYGVNATSKEDKRKIKLEDRILGGCAITSPRFNPLGRQF